MLCHVASASLYSMFVLNADICTRQLSVTCSAAQHIHITSTSSRARARAGAPVQHGAFAPPGSVDTSEAKSAEANHDRNSGRWQ